MPKDTFHKLNSTKKEKLTQAFLYEFSHKTYDEASITSVVKQLGIAKGSIYQYFDDKLDLFLYLKEICEKVKLEYIMHVNRDKHANFWSYFRELYIEGVKFDQDHPLKSRFLYNVSNNAHSPVLKDLMDTWMKTAHMVMKSMIQREIDAGHFRDDVNPDIMTRFLVDSSISIGKDMQSKNMMAIEENLRTNQPLLKGQLVTLMNSVDQYISLIRNAFDKTT